MKLKVLAVAACATIALSAAHAQTQYLNSLQNQQMLLMEQARRDATMQQHIEAMRAQNAAAIQRVPSYPTYTPSYAPYYVPVPVYVAPKGAVQIEPPPEGAWVPR